MKRPLFWISALLQAVYLLPIIAQVIIPFFYNRPYYRSGGIQNTVIIWTVVHIAVFYMFYLVLFPQFLFRRKIKGFVGYSLLSIVIAAISAGLLFKILVANIAGTDYNGYYYQSMVSNGLNSVLT